MNQHKDEFGKAIESIRSRLGATNWYDFVRLVEEKTGQTLSIGNLQNLGPNYKRSGAPSAKTLWELEKVGVFFENGELVTMRKLMDIFFGELDWRGDPKS